MKTTEITRRQFVKGTGALIVSFNLFPPTSLLAQSMVVPVSDADPTQLDSWLAIAPDELNPETRKRLLDAIAKASATTAPARTPSPRECAWCDIGKEDCPARIEEEVAVETALF